MYHGEDPSDTSSPRKKKHKSMPINLILESLDVI